MKAYLISVTYLTLTDGCQDGGYKAGIYEKHLSHVFITEEECLSYCLNQDFRNEMKEKDWKVISYQPVEIKIVDKRAKSS